MSTSHTHLRRRAYPNPPRVLTDVKITDPASLRQAIRKLHETYKAPHVVISSIPLKGWLKDFLPAHIRPPLESSDTDYLATIASSQQGNAVYAASFPCLPGYFSGVGDMFSALVLAHFQQSSTTEGVSSLSTAVSQAVSKTHAMLSLTHEAALALPEDERQTTDEELDVREPLRKIRRMRGRELRLIQGQDIIRGTQTIKRIQLQPWTEFWGV